MNTLTMKLKAAALPGSPYELPEGNPDVTAEVRYDKERKAYMLGVSVAFRCTPWVKYPYPQGGIRTNLQTVSRYSDKRFAYWCDRMLRGEMLDVTKGMIKQVMENHAHQLKWELELLEATP